MLTHNPRQRGAGRDSRNRPALRRDSHLRVMIPMLVCLVLLPGCLFRGKKTPVETLPTAPVRIALLPANIPDGNQDLRWVSMALPVMLAKELGNSEDLEAVPLWESIPIALETLGSSREISDEMPAYIASRLNARWATKAQVAPSKNGVALLLDFMPAKATLIAYRYKTETSIDSLNKHMREALVQFVRYLAVRRLSDSARGGQVDRGEFQQLAQALDREYGWFESAEPGKSMQAFQNLARTDDRLARLLFRPPDRPAAGTTSSEAAPAGPPASVQSPPGPEPAAEGAANLQAPAPAAPALPASEIIASSRAAPSPDPPAMPPQPPPGPGVFTAERPASQPAAKEPVGAAPASVPPGRPTAAKPSPGQDRGRYWIQVHSTQVRADAEEKTKKLSESGYNAEIVEVDLDTKGVWYRIRLKGYQSRKEAEEAAQKLLEQGMIKEYWIAATPAPE